MDSGNFLERECTENFERLELNNSFNSLNQQWGPSRCIYIGNIVERFRDIKIAYEGSSSVKEFLFGNRAVTLSSSDIAAEQFSEVSGPCGMLLD